MGIKSNQLSGKKFTERAWEELKKINWHEVNRLTARPFTIGLVGTNLQIEQMKQWLASFQYKLAYDSIRNSPDPTRTMNKGAEDKIVELDPSKPIDDKLVKSLSFCIVQKEFINDIRRIQVPTYAFDPLE